MNRVTITGRDGELVWGYHTAADLGSWSISAVPDGGTLTAHVVRRDAFRVTQHPLTFVVRRPSGSVWRWPIRSLQMTSTSVTADVDLSEE